MTRDRSSDVAAPALAMTSKPLVSVILPAFNASATLRSAVQSVLDDGEREIEVIVVDDGSTDASLDILRSIPDPRLRVIAQTYNMGLPNALNSGLEAARGRFVARMDADDVSLPGRFRAQMQAFAEDPDLVMCGTHAKLLDDASLSNPATHDYPVDPEDVRQEMWFRTAILHPTTMFDRARIPEASLFFTESLQVRQDHELFLRLMDLGSARNLAKSYLIYRRHTAAVTVSKVHLQMKCREIVMRKALEQRGVIFSPRELAAHLALCPRLPGEQADITVPPEDLLHWVERLFALRERLGIRNADTWSARLQTIFAKRVRRSEYND